MTVLIPVDAEVLVVQYLSAMMPDVHVSTVVDRRAGMVKVEQTGGDRPGHATDLPMITIQCWGADRGDASALCRKAFGHLWDIREHSVYGYLVRAVSVFGGPVPNPDDETGAERYQATVQLNLRPTPNGELP